MGELVELRKFPLRLHVLPGKLGPRAGDADIALYNRVFSFWQNYWAEVMAGINEVPPPSEDFFRQDELLVLLDHARPEPAVVAFVGVNHYHLATTVDSHPYFLQYGRDFLPALRAGGVRNVYSGQYFTVNAAYATKVTGVSYAAVIIGLMQETYAPLAGPHSAMIGLARTDNGSYRTVSSFGWEMVGAPVQLHNVLVKQMARFGAPLPHGDASVNDLVKRYWNGRQIHESGYETAQQVTGKRIAKSIAA